MNKKGEGIFDGLCFIIIMIVLMIWICPELLYNIINYIGNAWRGT